MDFGVSVVFEELLFETSDFAREVFEALASMLA